MQNEQKPAAQMTDERNQTPLGYITGDDLADLKKHGVSTIYAEKQKNEFGPAWTHHALYAAPALQPQEPVAWTTEAALTVLGMTGDGPFGDSDVDDAIDFLNAAETVRGNLVIAAPAAAQPQEKTYSREEVQRWRDDIAHAAADMVEQAWQGDGNWSWLVSSIRALAKNPAAQPVQGKQAGDGRELPKGDTWTRGSTFAPGERKDDKPHRWYAAISMSIPSGFLNDGLLVSGFTQEEAESRRDLILTTFTAAPNDAQPSPSVAVAAREPGDGAGNLASDNALLPAVLALDAAIHKVLIAGDDSGDELSDTHLRKTLEQAQHTAYRALISIGIERIPGAVNPLSAFLPGASPAAASAQQEQDRRDAARYRWLKARFIGYDFYFGGDPMAENDADRGVITINFEIDRSFACGKDFETPIDAAIAASRPTDAGQREGGE